MNDKNERLKPGEREPGERAPERRGETGAFCLTPLRPCRHTGCPNLVRGEEYCEKHRGEARRARRRYRKDRQESGAWHRLYGTRRWREMRAAQLIAEPYCRKCAETGLRTAATDVDHIRPHRGDLRLFYNAANLQSLCHACHSRKTIEEQREKSPPV